MKACSFCSQGERESVQMAGKNTEDRNETKEINPSSSPGSISNLFPLLGAVGFVGGNSGSRRSPWSAACCPSNPSEHHSYLAFMYRFIKHHPCYSTLAMAALHFLEEIVCLVSPSQTYPREFVVL